MTTIIGYLGRQRWWPRVSRTLMIAEIVLLLLPTTIAFLFLAKFGQPRGFLIAIFGYAAICLTFLWLAAVRFVRFGGDGLMQFGRAPVALGFVGLLWVAAAWACAWLGLAPNTDNGVGPAAMLFGGGRMGAPAAIVAVHLLIERWRAGRFPTGHSARGMPAD